MLREIHCPNGHSTFNLDYLEDEPTRIFIQCRQCNQVGEVKLVMGYGKDKPVLLEIKWRAERK